MPIKNLILLIALAFSLAIKAQDAAYPYAAAEKQLNQQYQELLAAKKTDKKAKSKAFEDSLHALLKQDTEFLCKMDSLPYLGKVYSLDEKIRIVSWNIPDEFGYSNYYCIVQYKNKGKLDTFILKENPSFKDERTPIYVSSWPGGLYYDIIERKHKGNTYYTLLGFNFNNVMSNKKVVDIIAFDKTGQLYFPEKMFIYNNQAQNRLVFEFAERAQMTLRYHDSLEMIIFDHLVPFRPSLVGQYQFYGPDMSQDGLSFEDGKWQHRPQIDVRN